MRSASRAGYGCAPARPLNAGDRGGGAANSSAAIVENESRTRLIGVASKRMLIIRRSVRASTWSPGSLLAHSRRGSAKMRPAQARPAQAGGRGVQRRGEPFQKGGGLRAGGHQGGGDGRRNPTAFERALPHQGWAAGRAAGSPGLPEPMLGGEHARGRRRLEIPQPSLTGGEPLQNPPSIGAITSTL